MRVAFFGTPNVAVPYLEALADSPHEVCLVVTQPDRGAGRARELRRPAVKSAAEERALCVLQPEACREREFLEAFRGCAPEIGIVVAYGQILPPELLACPPHGCVNVHYSLLPALRGAAPVQHALLQGMTETGLTVQWLSEELDAGDIILQEEVAVQPEDDQASLFARLNAAGVPLLLRALDLVAAGTAPRIPQDASWVSWAPELTPERCRLDWAQPAEEIARRVRACHPKPGAYTYRGNRRLKVLAVQARQGISGTGEGAPGTVVEAPGERLPLVIAGQGVVALGSVQPEGRRPMSGAEYARGARLAPGERLT